MVAKRNPQEGLTYEEQVAIARENLARGIAEHKKRVAAFEAEYGDPDEALAKFVRETFKPGSLLRSLNDYRRERGKAPIEEW
jgi:hypothetical protein